MNKSEMALLKEIQLEMTRRGCRAWRANVGAGWTGDAMRNGDGSIFIRNPRRFQTGLPNGFPDLIVICPNGRVIFMELKTEKGVLRDDQKQMHEFLSKMGQHVCVCRSVEDAIKEIEKDGICI